jgi:hypothetical protein
LYSSPKQFDYDDRSSFGDGGRALPLPTRLVPVEPLPEAIGERQLVFAHSMICMEGMFFTINGQTFDPERTDTIVQVGTVEEWEIVNGGGMMMMDFGPGGISPGGDTKASPAKQSIAIRGDRLNIGLSISPKITSSSIPVRINPANAIAERDRSGNRTADWAAIC